MLYIKYEGRFGNNLFQYCRGLCFLKTSKHGIKNPIDSKIIKAKNPKNKETCNIFQEGYFQDSETVNLFKKHKKDLFLDSPQIDGVLFM